LLRYRHDLNGTPSLDRVPFGANDVRKKWAAAKLKGYAVFSLWHHGTTWGVVLRLCFAGQANT